MKNNLNKHHLLEELINLRVLNLKSLFEIFIVFIIFFSIGITIIDILSPDEFDSSKSILNEENVQYKIRVNENIFRDKIIEKLNSVEISNSFRLIDSISISNSDVEGVKNYILLNKLRDIPRYKINIPVNKKKDLIKDISLFVCISEVEVEYVIDFDKLNKIITSNKEITNETIKYGNFLNTNYKFNKEIKWDYVIISAFGILALFLIFYFKNRIGGGKKKLSIETAVDNLNSDKQSIKELKGILNDSEINDSEILRVKELINVIENNLDSYEFDNVLKSVIYEDVIKSETRANELYNRSTFMLILGLLVGIVGILIFYFTLPQFGDTMNFEKYLTLTIRPTMVLIFIQSISFYLLKQYRTLIDDYKFFYNEYLKKTRIFIIYQLSLNETNNNDSIKKLIETLLNEKNEVISNFQANNDINNESLTVLKLILDKINLKG